MYIYWDRNTLGSKADNIILLSQKYSSIIPETFIIQRQNIQDFSYEYLSDDIDYILRPSFLIEDTSLKSYAGVFTSIFPIQKEDIIKLFSDNTFEEKFWSRGYEIWSIIIQKYVYGDVYWVYFSRNPDNIFEKWFYEVSREATAITSWKLDWDKYKLSFFQKRYLEHIWIVWEKLFWEAQDIEFCIQGAKIYVFQCRPINTGNKSIYNFREIQKIHGRYQSFDFDELWEEQDFFSYHVISNIFSSIYIDSRVYIRRCNNPFFLFSNKKKNENKNLEEFLKNYKLYLIYKYIFHIIYLFSLQRLDMEVLQKLFRTYSYSFLKDKKSNINISFDYNTNKITRLFLSVERQKNKSFLFLEKYKNEFSWKNFLSPRNYSFWDTLIFYKGSLLRSMRNQDNYIYKWKIVWILVDNSTYQENRTNQVFICKNLDFQLFDKIGKISGVIIQEGNLLSHNSILLREYKIPSIVHYKEYDSLKIWESISI